MDVATHQPAGLAILTTAAALVEQWQGAPAAVLLNHFLALPVDQQGETPEAQAQHQRDARALLAYIESGGLANAYANHQQREQAKAEALEAIAAAVADRQRKTQQRKKRKAHIRGEVAAMLKAGATHREMQARLQASGWEVSAAVNWHRRKGTDLRPRRPGETIDD